MYKILFIIGIVCKIHGQVVNRVRVINHREYMIDVIHEVVKRVDAQGWWNFQLPDVENHYDEMVVTWHLEGNVKYTNPFVASIQHVNLLDSSLNQVWTSTAAEGSKVEIRGKMRLVDMAIGFDIVSDLTDGAQRHTGLITYPVATFDFSIFRNAETHEMTATVTGSLDRTNNKIQISPKDRLADALVMLFDSTSFQPGVAAWGATVFQPIAEEIAKNGIVKFPGLCYDCAACELWAKYFFPDGKQSASPTFQKKLYSEHRMLCSRHFKWYLWFFKIHECEYSDAICSQKDKDSGY